MFLVALRSRSLTEKTEHIHSLIRKPTLPYGLLGEILPQQEQVLIL